MFSSLTASFSFVAFSSIVFTPSLRRPAISSAFFQRVVAVRIEGFWVEKATISYMASKQNRQHGIFQHTLASFERTRPGGDEDQLTAACFAHAPFG
jgi:hypothetical protein